MIYFSIDYAVAYRSVHVDGARAIGAPVLPTRGGNASMKIFANLFILVLLAVAAWFLGQKKRKRNPHSRKP
jgi:hypothetical protein